MPKHDDARRLAEEFHDSMRILFPENRLTPWNKLLPSTKNELTTTFQDLLDRGSISANS